MSSTDPMSYNVINEIREPSSPRNTDDYPGLREQAIANFQKPNLPNINVPEKIIVCLDVCCDNQNSLYRLGDGTTFSPLNMLKRVLDFFIHSKHTINKRTEFALIILKDASAFLVQNFTNNVRDIIHTIDFVNAEESVSETFDFKHVFDIIKQEVEIPEYKQSECIIPPPYIVRMVVLYARSKCVPLIAQDDSYLTFLKVQMYFYIDILFAHEDECNLFKCEEIYDALQNLDNGYSYVFEVSRNAAKIHESIAKLLAHPLQRLLQKNTDYGFGTRC
ncbi:BRISC and BRCA1-A complex member 1 [Pieris rapae]|uniref:BRISC and BRCA1-A complex member 1 n=1 Tax=Pieris rapae TaxID=64459 RepID=UPI000B9280FD|nr:BRISC and BRCA1-A complex member 1 [Pieris rapae]